MPLGLLILLSLVVMALVALGVRWYFQQQSGTEEVTWTEYWVWLFVASLVVAPSVGFVGLRLAQKDLVTYHENWGGWEAAANVREIRCHRDGPCYWEYDCDPYIVQVPYECGDSKQSRTCYRSETRYHSCPYVEREYTYTVDTTLGEYTIDGHRFPLNPQRNRWRRFERIPESVIKRAGVGEPEFWSRARDRLDRGTPGPVTKVTSYDNYVLASRSTILKQYGKLADEYVAQGLLPKIGQGILSETFYRSRKVHLVGCSTPVGPWNTRLEYLNGAFGSELHGEVQLVLVCDKRVVSDPDGYRLALEAYWQNTEIFKRTALPKNSVVVIIGSKDGKTVSWGRAFTGMPIGNEALLTALQSRFRASREVPWTPEAVIGQVRGQVTRTGEDFKTRSVRSSAVLTDVLWGVGNQSTRFARVSMSAKDANDIGTGFSYLAKDVELKGIHKFLILLFVTIFAGMAFVGIAFTDFTNNIKRSIFG